MKRLTALAITVAAVTFAVVASGSPARADEEVNVCVEYLSEDALSRSWTDRGPVGAGGTADGVETWVSCTYDAAAADKIIDMYRYGNVEFNSGGTSWDCYHAWGSWLGYWDSGGYHWSTWSWDVLTGDCHWLTNPIKVLTHAKLEFHDTAVVSVWSAVTEAAL